MTDIEKTLKFLRCAAFEEALKHRRPPQPFITISRQAGAGGSTLASVILKRMAQRREELFDDWRLFDRELCATIAGDPKLSVRLDTLVREVYRSDLADYLAQFVAEESPQAAVIKKVFQAVWNAAAAGRAVIVGRAASDLTRRLPLGVHVRLVAPTGARIARMMRRYGFARDQAEREMTNEDRSRASMLKTYFRSDIDDPLLYDAVWNTDRVPFDDIADAVLALVKARAEARGAVMEGA